MVTYRCVYCRLDFESAPLAGKAPGEHAVCGERHCRVSFMVGRAEYLEGRVWSPDGRRQISHFVSEEQDLVLLRPPRVTASGTYAVELPAPAKTRYYKTLDGALSLMLREVRAAGKEVLRTTPQPVDIKAEQEAIASILASMAPPEPPRDVEMEQITELLHQAGVGAAARREDGSIEVTLFPLTLFVTTTTSSLQVGSLEEFKVALLRAMQETVTDWFAENLPEE